MDQPPRQPETPRHPLPSGWPGLLAIIGPGIVVVGSVIGAGELINTPLQAAEFGFTLLWAVILSCVIKCLLQIEIGRHCVVHNRTTVEALNECPGPRFRGTSWAPLLYMACYTISLATSVGIIGALAGLMQAIVPASVDWPYSASLWGTTVVVLAGLLLRTGAYGHLEKSVAVMVGGFCVAVLVALVLIQRTPMRIRGDELLAGLQFSLGDRPRLAAYAVVSLIGALGTTANELFMYPYWLREKGYGSDLAHVGGDLWIARARRWIRGLRVDVGFATFIATVVTVAFYSLGAAVLHREGVRPHGLGVVEQMSQIFTQTQGSWSYAVFVAGAFCTLFSTLVVATAATGRMWADVLASMRIIDRADARATLRTHKLVQAVYLAGMLAVFLTIREAPGGLVVFGQFIAAVFNTPLIIFGICWAAYRTDRRVRMRPVTAAALLASVAIIIGCVSAGVAVQSGLLTSHADPNSAALPAAPRWQAAVLRDAEGGVIRGDVVRKRLALIFTGDELAESAVPILDELKQRGLRAGFFITGRFARNETLRPVIRRMVAEGHYIGPHSDSHPLYCDWDDRGKSLVSREFFERDLQQNLAALQTAGVPLDRRPRLFVPPYEWYNAQHVDWADRLGLKLINFTPGSGSNRDYAREGDARFVASERILYDILAFEQRDPHGLNGFLLLLHLGSGRADPFHRQLGKLLDALSSRQYDVVRVDALLFTGGA